MSEIAHRVLITGGSGYIGRQVTRRLSSQPQRYPTIVSTDIRQPALDERIGQVVYESIDVRDLALSKLLRRYDIQTVVHLASIVNPGGPKHRQFEYSVDVLGTKNVMECCLASGVEQLIVTSSGAAYGYFPDNPIPLKEGDSLRGNASMAYSDHKRLIEKMLAEYRLSHPQLKQLIFRPGTVLGARTDNSITALFERSWILGISGSDIPFVFIWDHDLVECIARGIENQAEGIYNLAGDGTLTMRQIAQRLNKPLVQFPPRLLARLLGLLRWLRLSRYGPEQLDFLRYRPVLSNEKLKREFGYVPQKSTREAFEFYLDNRRKR